MKKTVLAAIAAIGSLAAANASAEVGLGLRAGALMGVGADIDVGLSDYLTLRAGYNYLNYSRTVDDTGVSYDGTFKVSSFTGALDWHVFGGGFRFSLGAVAAGPKIDIVGTPTSGSYQIGNNTYQASQVGSLRGQIEIGNKVAPYVGIGWGNAAGKNHRVTFLFDIGAIYGGTPDVALAAQCGAGVPTNVCTQLQNDVAVEIQKIKDDATAIQWYPVISVGLGIRF